jgi:hypothetical protein
MKSNFDIAGWAAVLLALWVWIVPAAAEASQKCQCENGVIVHAMDDGDDACEDACSGMGGGKVWNPDEDEDDSGEEDGAVAPRHPPAHRGSRHR